jgi:hypothetical protein
MEITHKVTKKALVLEIPLPLLRHLAETHQEVEGGLKVKRIKDLAQFIGEQIADSDTEGGLKAQVDELILQAYEDDQPFIKAAIPDED